MYFLPAPLDSSCRASGLRLRILHQRNFLFGDVDTPSLRGFGNLGKALLLFRVVGGQAASLFHGRREFLFMGKVRFEKTLIGRNKIAAHAGFAIDHGGDHQIDLFDDLMCVGRFALTRVPTLQRCARSGRSP